MSDAEDLAAEGNRSSTDLRPESPAPIPPPQEQGLPPIDNEETKARLDKVMQSDVSERMCRGNSHLTVPKIGVSTLLNRLKQSVASARVSTYAFAPSIC